MAAAYQHAAACRWRISNNIGIAKIAVNRAAAAKSTTYPGQYRNGNGSVAETYAYAVWRRKVAYNRGGGNRRKQRRAINISIASSNNHGAAAT